MTEKDLSNITGPKQIITILGNGGVGKTALVLRMTQNMFFENILPTIDEMYIVTVEVDGAPHKVTVYDTAGQEDFIAMRDQYTRKGDGFLLVFSLSDRQSFLNIRNLKKNIERNKPGNFLNIVMVGNKVDLKDHRLVEHEEALMLAHELKVPYIETSAKTGESVKEAFSKIVKLNITNPPESPSIPRQIPKKKKKCVLL